MDRQMTLGHVGRGTGTVAPFNQIYEKGLLLKSEEDFAKIDALVIWGGADISPTLYGEKPTLHCGADETLSVGDKIEAGAMRTAREYGIPIIGICRGAQMACAISGGKLVQDVHGHGGDHAIITDDGRTIITSSVHHQMMYPFLMDKDDYKLIAWAKEKRSDGWYEGVKDAPPVEPEIIFFPKTKALAIQGHPEFMNKDCEFVQYCLDLVRKYLVKTEEIA